MRPRQILSANLISLKDSGLFPGRDTIKKIAHASGGKLSNGKVGRIVAASHTTDIEALADLAEVFGLQPWQLLVPSLNPQSPPVLIDASVITKMREVIQQPESRDVARPQRDDAATLAKRSTSLDAGRDKQTKRIRKKPDRRAR